MGHKGIDQDRINTVDLPQGVEQIVGNFDAQGVRFSMVVSRFNQAYTGKLLGAAVTCLLEHGARPEDIHVVWVPGAYEVPSMVDWLARRGGASAILALGLVIEGETPHADLINGEVARALSVISMTYEVPVIHEVVAVRNESQAEARCTEDRKSRGWYAAMAAIEMVRVYEKVK